MLEYVGLGYAEHANTETIVFGDDLENGMRVLVESSFLRGNPEHDQSSVYDRARLDETAAWCTVTQVKHRERTVRFVGVYDDGTMRVRVYSKNYGWIVKLDSIPE